MDVIEGAGRVEDKSGEIAQRVKEIVYEYQGMPIAAIIGALEIAKVELIYELR